MFQILRDVSRVAFHFALRNPTLFRFSSFSDTKRCKSLHYIQINFGRIAPANLVTILSGIYKMSVSHTETLETNNDADPAEAPNAELSASHNHSDTAGLSTTEVTDAQEPTVITSQTAEVATPSSESAESVNQNEDMDPQIALPVRATTEAKKSTSVSESTDLVISQQNSEVTMLETQSTDAKQTEIADLVAVNESEHHYPEKSILARSGESSTIKDHALNEALITPPANTVAITEEPTQRELKRIR